MGSLMSSEVKDQVNEGQKAVSSLKNDMDWRDEIHDNESDNSFEDNESVQSLRVPQHYEPSEGSFVSSTENRPPPLPVPSTVVEASSVSHVTGPPKPEVPSSFGESNLPIYCWRIIPSDAIVEPDGSLTFGDGEEADHSSVELEFSGPYPRYRFKTVGGPVIKKPILQPKAIFEDLATFVLPLNIVQKSSEHLPPFNKGFKMQVTKGSFTDTFFDAVISAYKAKCEKQKWEWDMATYPFTFVPDGDNLVLAENFADVFQTQKLNPECASMQLRIRELRTLPAELLSKDLKARVALLECYTVLQSSLAVAASLDKNEQHPASRAVMAIARTSLFPLQRAADDFFDVRYELRNEALKHCEQASPWVQELISSNPWSEKLFASETVREFLKNSRDLGKTGWDLLHISNKRPSSFPEIPGIKRQNTTWPPYSWSIGLPSSQSPLQQQQHQTKQSASFSRNPLQQQPKKQKPHSVRKRNCMNRKNKNVSKTVGGNFQVQPSKTLVGNTQVQPCKTPVRNTQTQPSKSLASNAQV